MMPPVGHKDGNLTGGSKPTPLTEKGDHERKRLPFFAFGLALVRLRSYSDGRRRDQS
jgi:hypothetical protein